MIVWVVPTKEDIVEAFAYGHPTKAQLKLLGLVPEDIKKGWREELLTRRFPYAAWTRMIELGKREGSPPKQTKTNAYNVPETRWLDELLNVGSQLRDGRRTLKDDAFRKRLAELMNLARHDIAAIGRDVDRQHEVLRQAVRKLGIMHFTKAQRLR